MVKRVIFAILCGTFHSSFDEKIAIIWNILSNGLIRRAVDVPQSRKGETRVEEQKRKRNAGKRTRTTRREREGGRKKDKEAERAREGKEEKTKEVREENKERQRG